MKENIRKIQKKIEQHMHVSKGIEENWRQVWVQYRILYLILLIYIVTSAMLLEPFFAWSLRVLLKYKGYSYITTEMMADFFSSPVIWIGLLAMILVICTLTMLLQVFTYEYIVLIKRERQKSVRRAFLRSLNFCIDAWRNRKIGIVLFIAGNAVFQNLVIILLAIRFVPDVWYIILAILKITGVRVGVVVGIIVLLIYYFLNFYTIAYMIYENREWNEARKMSRELFFSNKKNSVCGWGLRNLLNGLFLSGLFMVLITTIIGLIMVFVTRELRIAVFCTVQDHMYVLVLLLAVIFGFASQVNGNLCTFVQVRGSIAPITVYPGEKEKEPEFLKKRLLALLIFLLLGMDIVVTYDRIRNGGSVTLEHLGNLQITAHRGDSGNAPENTLPSVEKGIESAADYIEIDVQETLDGVVVLMHDSTLARTTGAKQSVSSLRYDQLKYLDAGEWFGPEFKGTPVPTLEEVLKICKGKCCLNIEIKGNKKTPDLEQHVVDLIHKYDFTRQCVVTSVYKSSLIKVKNYDPEIMTGYILSSAYGRYYLDKDIDFLSMRSTLVTERIVRLAHTYGKEVYVWTVNKKQEAIWLSQLGVDNIITDRPTYIRNVVYGKENNENRISLIKLILQ